MGNLTIGIHGEFQLGTLLGGQVNWPLGCRLAISKEYYLIQADLVQKDSGGLDVPVLLNATFGCSLPSGYLVVEAAGFFTFGRFEKGQDSKNVAEVFPNTTLPADIATTTTPMDNTTGLWLVLDLHSIEVLEHLLEIGVKGQPNRLALYVQLSNKKNAGENFQDLTLCAKFPDIKLLDHFTFSNLFFVLKAQSGKNKSFLLRGDITVNLFNKDYRFQGELASNGQMLTAKLHSDHFLATLFGDKMPGVAFNNLSLMVSHRFKDAGPTPAGEPEPPCKPGTSLIQLTGSVYFAGLGLDGELRLIEGKPALARLSLTHELALSAFFEQSIPNCTWPGGEVFDLRIREKSEIYYVQPGLPAGVIPSGYKDGFNILARISLTLVETLEFSLGIQVRQDGVTAAVGLEKSIDLFIIQITGKDGQGGPSFGLDISKEKKSIVFQGGVSFFQERCGNITAICSKDKGGKLKVAGNIQLKPELFSTLISKNTLNFSYNPDSGFSLGGWDSFFFSDPRIDFAKQLEKWAQGGRSGLCGAVGNFINRDLLKANFTLTPSFSTEELPENGKKALYMKLNGNYRLLMHSKVIVEIKFSDLVAFKLPEKLEWKALPDTICQALIDALPSLIKGILSNRESAGKVMFVLMGKEALKKAGTLLCRNLIDKAIANAMIAAATALVEEYGGDMAAGLTALLALITEMTQGGGDEPEPKPDPSGPPDMPENLVVVVAEDEPGQTGISFSWNPAPLAEQYRASLYDTKGTHLGEKTVPDDIRRVFFPITVKDPIAGYRLSVAAHGNNTWSKENSCSITRLVCSQPHATYEEGQGLHLIWNPPTGGNARNYEITIRTEQGARVEKSNTMSLVLTLDTPEDTATRYEFFIRALSILPSLSSEDSPELVVSRLPLCGNIQVTLSGEDIRATWAPLPTTNSRCALRLHAERSGKDWTGSANVSQGEYNFALPLDEGSGRFSLNLSVRPDAGASTLPSLWSEKVSVFRSWASLAVLAHDKTMSANACADLLLRDKPKATPRRLTCCLAHGGYTAEETAPALRHVFASVSPLDVALTLCRARYSREDAEKGLRTAWPDLPDTELTAALEAAYGTPETLEQAAARAFAEGLDGAACGTRLILVHPKMAATELAMAMAKAGYVAKETTTGIMTAWPDLSLANLAAALIAAYGAPETLEQAAARAFAEGLDGAACGTRLILVYPKMAATELAMAMAKAGYVAKETTTGIMTAWPDLSLANLAAALIAAYGAPETLEQAAARAFAEGLDGAACGTRLILVYPKMAATELAMAMAKAGYVAKETTTGIMTAWPDLSLANLAAALIAAYGKPTFPE